MLDFMYIVKECLLGRYLRVNDNVSGEWDGDGITNLPEDKKSKGR